jgi:hypothetical protein
MYDDIGTPFCDMEFPQQLALIRALVHHIGMEKFHEFIRTKIYCDWFKANIAKIEAAYAARNKSTFAY